MNRESTKQWIAWKPPTRAFNRPGDSRLRWAPWKRSMAMKWRALRFGGARPRFTADPEVNE